jgi:beta-N-acetylhexosaminidase
VQAAVKHFPGLGRVRANPDVAAGVTDRVTLRDDGYLSPFAAAVRAKVSFVMVSTAYYSRIDPLRPAAFSRTVITGMLRGALGFTGVVISDDLGQARQVAAWSPAARAVRFISAGGDMVLTVTPTVIPAMVKAVMARAASDAVFRAKVNAAVLRVLTAKQQLGLLQG